ncbi:uncharacterized protein LOC144641806 isoform X2 [Oculina patagonica]
MAKLVLIQKKKPTRQEFTAGKPVRLMKTFTFASNTSTAFIVSLANIKLLVRHQWQIHTFRMIKKDKGYNFANKHGTGSR